MNKAAKKRQPDDKAERETKARADLEKVILGGLEEPGLTFDKSGYAFLKLNLAGKALDSIHSSFSSYKHICYVDVSNNNLTDFAVFGSLPNLIDLNLKTNAIKDLKPLANEEFFPYLQSLNLAGNKIPELTPIKCPRLLLLNLSENRIDKGETFDGHPKLTVLNLRKNRLSSTAVIKEMPNVYDLNLGENKIKTIAGFENMGSLKTLFLRGNQLDTLGEESFPALESLEYLNLRENNISKMEEILKLKDLPKLRVLIFSFNPVIQNKGNDYFFETLIAMPNLNRINKHQITPDIRQKTWNHQEDIWKEQERKRIEAEEEERRKAEAENAES